MYLTFSVIIPKVFTNNSLELLFVLDIFFLETRSHYLPGLAQGDLKLIAIKGQRFSSMALHLPCKYKVQTSIPGTKKPKKQQTKKSQSNLPASAHWMQGL